MACHAGSAHAGARSYTVYAAGDIAYCGKVAPARTGAADTAQLVEMGLAATPHAAVLLLGDIVYQRATAAEFRHCYDPTWGRFKARTLPAPGNHEYYTPGARGYFQYFGDAAGPGYYRVQLGAWQVFSLDSNLTGKAQQTQLAWLARELAAHPAPCTLAYWHHPLYSSGWHGSSANMRAAWQLLQDAGAEVVLSGHDHTYERFAAQDAHGRRDARGLRQFVVGTGGSYHTPFKWPLAHSEMRDNSRFGVLRLTLRERGYDWQFLEARYDGLPNGQAPDSGSAPCH
ncbi:metallophosphoesterase [Massilia sp. PAMC28688]|nr:metallophosphoesterase [Massilia sp. PAMC28688]